MWLIILILLCGNSFALNTVTLRTGLAYSQCNGNILGKYNQGIGDSVPVSDGCVIVDVADKNTLDSIQLYQDPSISVQNQLDALRQKTLNDMADAQILANPAVQSQEVALKQQGAK